uniref:Peptidase S1 domain-containing protein n=1 Tax=Clytia hemisphaerica TaxID=252671 RepID=A0A7M5WYY6_9CNID
MGVFTFSAFVLFLATIPFVTAQNVFNDFAHCGMSAKLNRDFSRIVGGTEAERKELPWQAALWGGSGKPYCGGTLISSQYVVTAAHCVDGSSPQYVVLGAHVFGGGTENNRQVRQVSNVISHENYNSQTLANDIALIKLNSPVEYNDYVKPACVPESGDAPDPNTEVVISGWGTTQSGGSQPDTLRETKVSVVSRSSCRQSYGQNAIDGTMLCASSAGKDSCQGDSGGPLVERKASPSNGERFYLAGVVSWGYGCASPGYPGVYADVSALRSWIEGKGLKPKPGTPVTPGPVTPEPVTPGPVTPEPVTPGPDEEMVHFIRYWSWKNRDHYYSTSFNELGFAKNKYFFRGVQAFLLKSKAIGSTALYQYFKDGGNNFRNTDHFYTTDPDETSSDDSLAGYGEEKVVGYCFEEEVDGTVPLYRYYRTRKFKDHFYTTDGQELGTPEIGKNAKRRYVYEGIACHVYPGSYPLAEYDE